MSVIFFDADELGNVAAAAVATIAPYGVHGHDKILREVCVCLAHYSEANASTYRRRYGARDKVAAKCKGVAWSTVYRRAKRNPANADKARGAIGLLIYNLDEPTPALLKLRDILAESVGGLQRAA